jgi:lysophospholipase L1-like esterase
MTSRTGGTTTWRRYVAIGDSTTEGMDDPLPAGDDGIVRYRGWADRLAEHVDRAQGGGLEYANLAVRGRTTAAIREGQLLAALELQPDLVTVVAGVNDLLRPSFDVRRFVRDLQAMQAAFVRENATVLTFTMPDLSPVLPLARPLRRRLEAMNEGIRRATHRSGALLLDLAAHPVTTDPRLWSEDRLHANSLGHERIAAALAHRLGLPTATDAWQQPLPASPPRRRGEVAAAELVWMRTHLGPWVLRRVRGRSSGDGVRPKRPDPGPLS